MIRLLLGGPVRFHDLTKAVPKISDKVLSERLKELEAAGYLEVEKTYRGRVPLTRYRITEGGRGALRGYRQHLVAVLERLS